MTRMERRTERRMCWMAISVVLMAIVGASPALAAGNARAAIEAANKKWEAAAARGDGAGVASLYTANAQLLPPKSAPVTGTEAIGAFWQEVFDSGVKSVSLVTVAVEGRGDTAYETGKVELRGADGQVLDRGNYIVIWRKVGSSWKLHHDIWNTSVAADEE